MSRNAKRKLNRIKRIANKLSGIDTAAPYVQDELSLSLIGYTGSRDTCATILDNRMSPMPERKLINDTGWRKRSDTRDANKEAAIKPVKSLKQLLGRRYNK